MSEILSISDKEKRARLIRTTLEKIGNLKVQRDEINALTKAEFDVLEAQGLNRKAIKDAAKLIAAEEKKRFEYEKTKAIVYDALGWHFQPDLFADADADKSDPDEKDEQLPGLGAEDLANIDTSDDPGEDEDDEAASDFTRGERAESRHLAAVGR